MRESGLEEYRDCYVKGKDIKLALSKYVIPQVAVEQCHDDLKLSLFKNIKDNKICMEVADVEVAVTQCKRDLLARTKSVEEELPLNRWLYEYIYSKLDSSLFITEHREENIKPDGFPNLNVLEVNEYAKSVSDLVIYKRFDTQFKSLKCCFITISKEAEKEPEKDLCGMVAELKISDKTSYPVWELGICDTVSFVYHVSLPKYCSIRYCITILKEIDHGSHALH